MLRTPLPVFLLLASGCARPAPPVATPGPVTLAITGVHVIPMDRDEVLRDRTILIAADRIAAITPASEPAPPGARSIDARGQYVLPGLWDMHVHALDDVETFFPLLLAHGVTGVRDMGGFLDSLRDVRERLRTGRLVGPRLVAAGPLLDGPRQRWSHAVAWHLENPGQARVAVDSLARAGVDLLKVYSTLSRDAWLALGRAARGHGLPLAGHVPFAVSAEEASTQGQRSLEHIGLDVTTLPCVPDGGARMRRLLGIWTSEGYEAYLLGTEQLRRERGEECLDRLYATYRANGTWVTPTMVNSIKDGGTVNHSALALLDPARRESCLATVAAFGAAADSVRQRFHDGVLEDVAHLHRAGVGLLAGTDLPNPCIVPGASLHDELEWLVQAGLSPFQALETATRNPALFLGEADSLGAVRAGFRADLVLLSANPLGDIRATRQITGVVRAGRHFHPDSVLATRIRAGPG